MACSPRSNIAGTSRLPTFSMTMTAQAQAFSSISPLRDHFGLEMAAGACIDLHYGCARRTNALTVIRCRLIAFHHVQRQLAFEVADGSLEQRRLAGARHETRFRARISRPANQARFLAAQRIVLGQNARLEGDHLSVVFMIMCVVMSMSMRVAVMGSVCMHMIMVVAMSIAMRMFVSMIVGMAVPRAVGMDMLVATSRHGRGHS